MSIAESEDTITPTLTGISNNPVLSNLPADRPMTGDEYVASLRDGREIYIYGERVRDVTEHPAFYNPIRMTARLYDALHDPEQRDALTSPTDTGNGGRTMSFFRAARSVEDMTQDQRAIKAWAEITYGWMGRSPDYKAAFLGTLGANSAFYTPFEDNAKRWYAESQNKVLYWNHAIVNPPVDRNRPADEVEDVFVHVEKETDAGLVVSGAKVVATGSALTHFNFIGYYGMPFKKKEYALIATVPMSSPGMKLICRPSYTATSAAMGAPFDYPLSSRLDENDTVLILDKVLIPWENVFSYGDADRISNFVPLSGFLERFTFQGTIRLAVKLKFIAGLLLKAVEMTGTKDFRGVQSRIGEVIAWQHLFEGLSDAAIRDHREWENGTLLPSTKYGMIYRWFMQVGYSRVKEIIEQDVASALVYMNSSSADFKNPEIRKYLDKYARGSNGFDAEARMKLMKALWDSIGSEFGGRHELYERNYAGNHEGVRVELYGAAEATGNADGMRSFVDRFLSEYDLDGWTSPDLKSFDELRTNTFTSIHNA